MGLQLGHWRVGLSFQSTRQINQSLSAWLPFQSRLSLLALRLSLLYRLVLLFKNSCFLCNLSLRLTDLCVVNKLIQEILHFAVFNFLKKIHLCLHHLLYYDTVTNKMMGSQNLQYLMAPLHYFENCWHGHDCRRVCRMACGGSPLSRDMDTSSNHRCILDF